MMSWRPGVLHLSSKQQQHFLEGLRLQINLFVHTDELNFKGCCNDFSSQEIVAGKKMQLKAVVGIWPASAVGDDIQVLL